jgi:hypothetical protein
LTNKGPAVGICPPGEVPVGGKVELYVGFRNSVVTYFIGARKSLAHARLTKGQGVWMKAAAFVRWHEPDDARVSSPDL